MGKREVREIRKRGKVWDSGRKIKIRIIGSWRGREREWEIERDTWKEREGEKRERENIRLKVVIFWHGNKKKYEGSEKKVQIETIK